jgi:hyperosmotically inducible periplasmic protein
MKRKKLSAVLSVLAAAAVSLALMTACGESDTTLTTKVKAKILADRAVTSSDQIEVSTANHVVTLGGTTDTEASKERALTLARSTEGVSNVVDNLRVSTSVASNSMPGGVTGAVSDAAGKVTEAVDDAAITTAIKAKLIGDSSVSGTKIHVDTKDGVVTLQGTVKSEDEKSKAVQIARDTKGVQRVEDQLTVQSS